MSILFKRFNDYLNWKITTNDKRKQQKGKFAVSMKFKPLWIKTWKCYFRTECSLIDFVCCYLGFLLRMFNVTKFNLHNKKKSDFFCQIDLKIIIFKLKNMTSNGHGFRTIVIARDWNGIFCISIYAFTIRKSNRV